MKKEKEVELKIYSIASSLTESIIFLDEDKGIRILPIWIGPVEAQAIAIKMSGYPSPRPMTHDLFYSLIKKLGMTIEKVVITDIIENTYYATINIKTADNKIVELDCRPSDAIAIAVRAAVPIYAKESVFSKTQYLTKPISSEEVQKFKEKLKNLKPEDIIKGFDEEKNERGEG